MSIGGGVNFGPAQACMERILAKFHGIEDCTDLNIRGGMVSVVRRNGACEEIDVLADDQDIAELGMLMSSAFNLELSDAHPILEKRLPPRWRVTLSHPSIEQDGRWDCSIRFLPTDTIPLGRYVEDGYMELGVAKRLVEIASTRNTMLIAGATGAGKTTLLRSIIGEIPARDRLVVIEDRAELNIARPNMSAFTTTEHGTFTDLIAHTMSKDPDVIVVGEVRGREAGRFVTIAASGHPCMTTLHAESGDLALVRLHRMVRLTEPNFDRAELDQAVQAVCHVRVDPSTGGRRVSLWEPGK